MPVMRLLLGTELPRVPLFVALDGHTLATEIDAGRPVPRPFLANAVLDTGALVTCVSAAVVTALGLTQTGRGESQTAGGLVPVRTFRVSVGLPPVFGLPDNYVLDDDLLVGELPVDLPGVDCLLGMDVLRKCRLTLDGPAGTFALEV